MANYTITHSENAGRGGGWTSFWSYVPDWMARMGNRMYSFKNGQLWIHNDSTNPLRNNFYGAQFFTSVKTVFNDAMEDDKIFKTLIEESDQKWAAAYSTNYTEGAVTAEEFETHESRQFTFLRKNEDETDLRGHSNQGIGVIKTVVGLIMGFNRIPNMINIGDRLFQLSELNEQLIGIITAIDKTNFTITVDAITTLPVIGMYSYAKKNSRVEGAEIRGYYMEVLLTNEDPAAGGELFAVSSKVVKSYI